jgi:hypothetical protein
VLLNSVFTTSNRAKEMTVRPPTYNLTPILLPRPRRRRGGCRCAALRALDSHGG